MVKFDNSYSIFKSKRIRYSVQMVSSMGVDELEAAAEALNDVI